jgi:hypothetical protein
LPSDAVGGLLDLPVSGRLCVGARNDRIARRASRKREVASNIALAKAAGLYK